SASEKFAYEESLKYYRDVKNSLDTAFADGRQEGANEKAIKMAEKCLKKGYSITETAELTELSLKEVEEIAKKLR
ncbi:MAG: hypothetical protein EAZ97_04705, partial [Bacteroidetes bacterium]